MKVEEGTVEVIYNNQKQNPLHTCPVLQILSYQKISSSTGEKFRYRANLSDGVHYMRAVFSSEVTSLFDKELISKYSLIKFDKFCVRSLKDNNYLYIQDIKEYEMCNIEIGSPVNFETGKASLNDPTRVVTRAQDEESPVKRESNFDDEKKTKFEEKRMKMSGNRDNLEKKENEIQERTQPMKVGDTEITCINKLNPFHNKWVIKGRIVLKSDIRKFNSKRGEGKLFSFEIADDSSQIKVVAFSELVDVFYPLIEVGKVYTISKAQVKMANKQFSNNNNDYEIHLEQTSDVNLVEDGGMPKFFFNFVKIGDLSASLGTADVIAVVKEAFPVSTFITKSTQKESSRRDVILVDDTGSIKCTFWGQKAEEEIEVDSVIALKSVKVSEYGGVSLSGLHSTQVYKNPDISESHVLLGWYKDVGSELKVDIPEREVTVLPISDIKNKEMTFSACKATLLFFKEDAIMYDSCREEGCNKKVFRNDFGMYRCEKCDKEFDQCKYRFMVSVNIGDYTGQIWAMLFNDQAVALFGVSCEEFREMADSDANMSQIFIKRFQFKDYIVSLRAKQDTYNDEVRMRYTIGEIKSVNFLDEARKNIRYVEQEGSK